MTNNIVTHEDPPAEQERWAVDEQTGHSFRLQTETRIDHFFAIVSIVYLLLMMVFFLWQIFDVWMGQYALVRLLRYPNIAQLASPSFRLPIYAFIGGALGGIVNGIRSFLVWHAERYAFGQRFVWKYVTAPWLGGSLALFTYALIRSGVAIFSGDSAPDSAAFGQALATFGVGVLAGYGSQKVFVWLDAQVTRLFQVQLATVIVPDLAGKTQAEAEDILREARLKLGEVLKEDVDDAALVDKIIRQTPPSRSAVSSDESVSVTIGRQRVEEGQDQTQATTQQAAAPAAAGERGRRRRSE